MGLATETQFTICSGESSPVVIQMRADAIDSIVREILDDPRAETGGLLLGKVGGSGPAGSRSLVRVEKYRRVPFSRGFNYNALEEAAADILSHSELMIVGVYRSHLNSGFQPEPCDFEAADRYFNDPSDLLLLIKPETGTELRAQFFTSGERGGFQAAGPLFSFPGRAVGSDASPEPAPAALQEPRPRRLVPDFIPDAVEPARARPAPPQPFERMFSAVPEPPAPPDLSQAELPKESWVRRWWPLGASLALVAGVLFLVLPAHPSSAVKPAASTAGPVRPLGLSVEPEGRTWTVSWNPNATALHDPKSVQLFVREGGASDNDGQKRIDLSPRDLSAGTYLYQPSGNDVTFRLEATESSGRIAAESFRVLRTTAPAPEASPASPAASIPKIQQAPTKLRIIAPKAIHRVPPTVPASIRPRIRGKIPIDIRVKVDDRGRVVSAVPAEHYSSGLDSYLAIRAVDAAREWRFNPARENGKAVAGQDTIHFIFEK